MSMAFLSPSPIELMMIAAIALIVLGPKRLPEAARSLGKGMREMRASFGSGDDEDDDSGGERRDSDPPDEPEDDGLGDDASFDRLDDDAPLDRLDDDAPEPARTDGREARESVGAVDRS